MSSSRKAEPRVRKAATTSEVAEQPRASRTTNRTATTASQLTISKETTTKTIQRITRSRKADVTPASTKAQVCKTKAKTHKKGTIQ